ncbi:MAG: MarR family transcriptional regulator [Flavobacteriales bacterium CG_4_9_14_3_um_filter_40_17]|nr:MAG: MarR family transcriptional regulator [Flavobacteriales bacterium CG_4_9_14_3_um_filter_40_17]
MTDTIKTSRGKQAVINLLITANLLSEKINELLKPFDISSEQFNVLRILRGRKGEPANMCDIQDRMIAKMSNTTRLVEKLLKKGLVDRKTCPFNRRKVEITITEKGIKTLRQIDPLIVKFEENFIQSLNFAEAENFIFLLNTLKNPISNQ